MGSVSVKKFFYKFGINLPNQPKERQGSVSGSATSESHISEFYPV